MAPRPHQERQRSGSIFDAHARPAPWCRCSSAFASLSAGAATTIDVTTTAGVVAVDGACSLVEAIQAADRNTTVNECVVGAGGSPFTIKLVAGQTYTASAAHYHINGPSMVGMEGGETIILEGNGATIVRTLATELRLFEVTLVGSGSFTMRNLTLRNGSAQDGGR